MQRSFIKNLRDKTYVDQTTKELKQLKANQKMLRKYLINIIRKLLEKSRRVKRKLTRLLKNLELIRRLSVAKMSRTSS